MRTLLCILFFGIVTSSLNAQPKSGFEKAICQGDEKFSSGEYQAAIHKYIAAEAFDPSRRKKVEEKLNKVFEAIDSLRLQAESAKQQALAEKEKAAAALAKAEKAKLTTQKALDKAQALGNALYFYKDRFALASAVGIDRNSFEEEYTYFYFMDKSGKPVLKLGEWEEGELFDKSEFARVQERNTGDQYLIDTSGNKYLAAYTIEDLDSSITALDLRNTQLDSFPSEILAYTQLEILLINGQEKRKNKIHELPNGINKLENLEVLQMDHCQLEELPDQIGGLRQLRVLTLNHNSISTLPATIGNLKRLKRLSIGNNKIQRLPGQIGAIYQLNELEVGHNKITDLPGAFWGLDSLNILKLGGNQISILPEQVGNLTQLRKLDLSHNELRALPPSIGQLENLNTLLLFDNKVQELPPSIGKLSQLEKLQAGANELENLPLQIGNLNKLEHLFLDNNELKSIPSSIGQLQHLRYLVLTENQISEFPKTINNLSQLKSLNASRNDLKKLPGSLDGLVKLASLKLYENNLKEVPRSIGQLISLEYLDLGGNQLRSIPSQIRNLQELHKLYLHRNKLTAIPSGVGEMSNLEELRIWGNPIANIPEALRSMKSLRGLHLNATHLTPDGINYALSLIPELETLYLPNLGLTELPKQVYQLPKLKKLILKNEDEGKNSVYCNSTYNYFSTKEQRKIVKRLPWCEIVFDERTVRPTMKAPSTVEAFRLAAVSLAGPEGVDSKSEFYYVRPSISFGNFSLTKKTSLREQPTAKSKVIRRLHEGLEVKALEKVDKYWWKVQVDGKTGYAKAFLLEEAE